MNTRRCLICGNDFEPHRTQKYCSEKCKRASLCAATTRCRIKRLQRPLLVDRTATCVGCGKSFVPRAYNQKCCSDDCRRLNLQRWQRENPERLENYVRRWRKANRDFIRKRDRERYWANLDKARARVAEYHRRQRKEDPEHVRQIDRARNVRDREKRNQRSRDYWAAHRDDINARNRDRYANDEDWRQQKLDVQHRYMKAHPERIREKKRLYGELNRDRLSEKFRRYRAEHYRRIRAKERERELKNRDARYESTRRYMEERQAALEFWRQEIGPASLADAAFIRAVLKQEGLM